LRGECEIGVRGEREMGINQLRYPDKHENPFNFYPGYNNILMFLLCVNFVIVHDLQNKFKM